MRIPIVDPLAAHLKKLRKNNQAAAVAPSLAGLPSSGFQTGLSWQFGEILAAAGVTGRNIEGVGKGRGFRSKTFHSARHTCNSLLANAGIPADVRKMITGHSDTATNLDYTHLTDQTKANALVKAFARKKSRK
jgi:integrase